MDSQGNVISFGKHSGKSYTFILETDISYCNWVLKQYDCKGSMKQFQLWLREKAKKVTCEVCNGSGLSHIM